MSGLGDNGKCRVMTKWKRQTNVLLEQRQRSDRAGGAVSGGAGRAYQHERLTHITAPTWSNT